MKKIIALLLSALMIVAVIPAFASCSTADSSGKLKIVTTIFPYYDICRNIVGDKAEVTMLIPAGSEVHEYEPTPQDIVTISKADMFVYNGGESDSWVDKVLDSIDSDVAVFSMFDYAKLLNEQDINHNELEENDEHIWTSISNVKTIAETLSSNLQPMDTANADYYAQRTEKFLSELDELNSKFEEVVSDSARLSIVVADRFPLLYFVKEYGLDYLSAFPGCSSETQPSIKTMKTLTDYVKKNKIPVVFHMDNTNENLAKTVCDETGAKVRTFYSCHNVTKKQFDDGVSYISLMELNLKALKEALS